jgi:hypothetical protein
MKLCFVSVNGPREPYLLDEPQHYQHGRLEVHLSVGEGQAELNLE